MHFQSLNIGSLIANSNFYGLDRSLQKDLLLIIQISQKPKFVRASKFFVLKYSTFTTVSLILGSVV